MNLGIPLKETIGDGSNHSLIPSLSLRSQVIDPLDLLLT